jgi:hypothetical protein
MAPAFAWDPISFLTSAGLQLSRPQKPAESRYPGRMLAFMLKKLVGSDFALSAVSRVHCWPV